MAVNLILRANEHVGVWRRIAPAQEDLLSTFSQPFCSYKDLPTSQTQPY